MNFWDIPQSLLYIIKKWTYKNLERGGKNEL